MAHCSYMTRRPNRLAIPLTEEDYSALIQLAAQEYRTVPRMAMFIIRLYLLEHGFVPATDPKLRRKERRRWQKQEE